MTEDPRTSQPTTFPSEPQQASPGFKKHGVHPNVVGQWKRLAIENMATSFGGGEGSGMHLP